MENDNFASEEKLLSLMTNEKLKEAYDALQLKKEIFGLKADKIYLTLFEKELKENIKKTIKNEETAFLLLERFEEEMRRKNEDLEKKKSLLISLFQIKAEEQKKKGNILK